MDWSLLLSFVKFSGFLLLIIYPAGFLLYRWIITANKPSISGSLVLGLFLVTLETYFLGLLGLYKFALPLIIIQAILSWFIYLTSRQAALPSPRLPLAAKILVILSLSVNSLMLVPFGRPTLQGMSLYGAHFVDSTWHLALINSLTKSLPPQNPLFAGTPLTNYHYLADLQIALIHRLTNIPIPDLYFRVIGPFYLLILSLLIYNFVSLLTGKPLGGIAALVFIMISSNIYYLTPLIFPQAQITPSVMWVDFFSSKTVNYPLLFSLAILFVFLNILWINRRLSFIQCIALGFLSGCLFAVKSHTALVWVGALGFTAFFELWRKNLSYLFVFITSLAVILILSKISISSGIAALQFNPLWFIRVMYESPEHLNHVDWELRRQTLLSLHAYLGVVKLYLQGFTWFMFINFGPLIVGLFSLFDKKIPRPFRSLLLGLFLTGITLTMALTYTSTAIVTIQFIYPSLVVTGILTAYGLTQIFKRQRIFAIISTVAIWAVLLPGTAYTVLQYTHASGSMNISPQLTSALKFLSQQPFGVVLTDNNFWSGSVIPGFSGQPVFLGDLQILDSLGVNYTSRQQDSLSALSCKHIPDSIRYLLTTKPLPSNCATPLFTDAQAFLYLKSKQAP